MLSYLAFRPAQAGPLFIHLDSSRSYLVRVVREALQSAGIDISRYNGHSFRIGAASTAAQVGLPDSFIQTLGRWKSSAILSYLRIPRTLLMNVTQQLLS
jgi:integrase